MRKGTEMQDHDTGPRDLDDLFAEARQQQIDPAPALVLRILADAEALQPRPAVRASPPPARSGLWASLSAVFGGGGAVAGMGTAMLAGLFIGVVQPEPVLALTGGLWPAEIETLDLLPDFTSLLAED